MMRFRSTKPPTRADVGRRVTIRRRLADGTASDVLGILVEAESDHLTVERPDGARVRIVPAEIVAARVIGP
jgi:hypothetical protein